MKVTQGIRTGLALLVGALIAGCDAATAPTSAPRAGLLPGISTPTLLQCATTEESTGAAVIGPAGGVVRVGQHFLEIPGGALSEDVLIQGRAPAGNYVELQFEPHGLVFAQQARLVMSYEHCGLTGLLLQVVYVDDSRSILEILPSLNNVLRQRVAARVSHFSSYMLAN